jgi:hypothetical protein
MSTAFTLFHACAILHGKRLRLTTLSELHKQLCCSLPCGQPIPFVSGRGARHREPETLSSAPTSRDRVVRTSGLDPVKNGDGLQLPPGHPTLRNRSTPLLKV